MIYLNENEKKHIEKFIMIADDYKCKEMILKWDDGNKIVAIYKDFIEDENDYDIENANYEEFWSFVFEFVSKVGNPDIYITSDNYFLINYHNFPKEILVDGVKIN